MFFYLFISLGDTVIHLDPRDEKSNGNVSLSNSSGIFGRCHFTAQVIFQDYD